MKPPNKMGLASLSPIDWDDAANHYAETLLIQEEYFDSYDSFLSLLPSLDSEILDIGCGPGSICKYLLEKRPDFKLTGIDPSEKMLVYARKHCPNALFYQLKAQNILQLQKRPFDGISIGFCIPYLEPSETRTLLADCTKLIKTGGALYLSFIESINPVQINGNSNSSNLKFSLTLYSPLEIKHLLLSCGFVPLFQHHAVTKTSATYNTFAVSSIYVPKFETKSHPL